MTKRYFSIIALAFGLFVGGTSAVMAEEGPELPPAGTNVRDTASLQRGAKLFFNYCVGCHSLKYVRYSRIAEDLGLSEQDVMDNLNFTGAKFGETVVSHMPEDSAKEWFGKAPPDLSLEVRAKGQDWVFNYLNSFYLDPSRPVGWNNTVFANASMPNPLWELQGERRPVYTKVEQHGHETEVFKGWEQVTPGTLTPVQYDNAVGDLVSYLQWMAEPAQNTRIRIGVWVLLFLAMSVVFVWRLNASYWKDVK